VSPVGGGNLFGNVQIVMENLGIILLIGIGGIAVPALAGTGWKLWRKWRGAQVHAGWAIGMGSGFAVLDKSRRTN
jgi:hypothetical protein